MEIQKPIHQLIQTTAKIKNYIIGILLAVVISTAFFAHKYLPTYHEDIAEETIQWQSDKKIRTEKLNAVKEFSKGSQEYFEYSLASYKTDRSFQILNEKIDSVRFGAFKHYQYFWGEFGWALGLFIYALIKMIKSFVRKQTNDIFEDFTILTIAVFYLRWCFNKEDFFLTEYLIYNIATSITLSFSLYLIINYKTRYIRYLENKVENLKVCIKDLNGFIWKTRSKVNDVKSYDIEMYNVFEKITKNVSD